MDTCDLGWNAPTKIKLIRELTLLLTSIPLHILMQKLLKSMINSVNPSTFKPMLAMVERISTVKF